MERSRHLRWASPSTPPTRRSAAISSSATRSGSTAVASSNAAAAAGDTTDPNELAGLPLDLAGLPVDLAGLRRLLRDDVALLAFGPVPDVVDLTTGSSPAHVPIGHESGLVRSG